MGATKQKQLEEIEAEERRRRELGLCRECGEKLTQAAIETLEDICFGCYHDRQE